MSDTIRSTGRTPFERGQATIVTQLHSLDEDDADLIRAEVLNAYRGMITPDQERDVARCSDAAKAALEIYTSGLISRLRSNPGALDGLREFSNQTASTFTIYKIIRKVFEGAVTSAGGCLAIWIMAKSIIVAINLVGLIVVLDAIKAMFARRRN